MKNRFFVFLATLLIFCSTSVRAVVSYTPITAGIADGQISYAAHQLQNYQAISDSINSLNAEATDTSNFKTGINSFRASVEITSYVRDFNETLVTTGTNSINIGNNAVKFYDKPTDSEISGWGSASLNVSSLSSGTVWAIYPGKIYAVTSAAKPTNGYRIGFFTNSGGTVAFTETYNPPTTLANNTNWDGNQFFNGNVTFTGFTTFNGASTLMPTGTVIIYMGAGVIPIGFTELDGKTIGNTGSNADLSGSFLLNFYRLVWFSFPNLPVFTSGGAATPRGVDADADFNAGKQLRIPDGRGRMIIGTGQGGSLTNRIHGTTGGEESHILTNNEMPSHNHGVNDPGHNHLYAAPSFTTGAGGLAGGGTFQAGTNTGAITSTSGTGITINNSGGGQAHNVMNPFLTLRFLVKI